MIRYACILPQPAAPVSCRRALVDRLAEDMREMAFAGQNVSFETLAARGYSAVAIRRLGSSAAAIARRRSIRHIEA